MQRLFLNRSEPAKKSGQNIPKNRYRTTIAERIMETLAELPFIGDQVVCFYLDKRDTRDTLTRAIRLCPTRWAARSFAAARISASVRGNVTPGPRGT